MEEQLISVETAILAKEKGFTRKNNCACRNGWVCYLESFTGQIYTEDFNEMSFDTLGNSHLIECPTQSLLQKWLREIHNIQVYAHSSTLRNGIYSDYIAHVNGISINDARDEEYKSYEEALEIGLLEGLKLIK